MLNEPRLLINGELVAAEGGATYETLDPSTGEVFGTAPDATVGDARRAVVAARAAFEETDWSTNVDLRVRCLRQFHEALDKHREELREIVVAESGIPVMLTTGMPGLDSPIEFVSWYADLLERYEFTQDLGVTTFAGADHHRWIEKEAVGVTAAIVPYNFPVQIALAKVAPAMAAGCTTILKGPPETPLVTAALGQLLAEHTDTPPGVVNVLTGAAPEVGAVLTTDPDVDMVSFTGSTATGRKIMAAAADTVKKLFLELGGKSAFIVLDDADVDLATMMSGFMVCSHAGQGCALPTRLLLPRARFDEAAEKVAATMAGVTFGDPRDPGVMMGPLVSARQRDKVHQMVSDAVAAGATALTGGKPVDRPGFFYEPTLLVGVDPDSAIAQDEVFGPVLVALPHDGDDDAVRIANNSIFGLSGTVWGADAERVRSVARRIRSGTLSLNGGSYYGADAPFGGYKQSGIGREMGVAGLEEYLEMKTLAEPAS